MIRRRALSALALVTLLAAAQVAAAAPAAEPGEVIVKFKDAPRTDQVTALDAGGAQVDEWLPIENTAVVKVVGSNRETLDRLEADPRVEWAEPNYRVHSFATPNDERFADQWSLLNSGQVVDGVAGTAGADVGITSAWDTTTGADHVSVAVVDGGVELTHPDLAPNMTLTNPGETGGGRETNGVDDDGNGLVDDWRGWDWVSQDNDPSDLGNASHGSVVAGIIGARGNDRTGVARGLVERAHDVASGPGLPGFGASVGCRRLVCVRGPTGSSDRQCEPGWRRFAVAVPQRGGRPLPRHTFCGSPRETAEATTTPGRRFSPCNLPYQNVLCVGATNQDDDLALFSNFGPASVDLAAPGENVLSTVRLDKGVYDVQDGTSFAAPLAAGVAGLVLAANPAARTSQLRSALITGATPLPTLSGRVASGARLNAAGALANVPPPGAPPTVSALSAAEFGQGTAVLRGVVTPTDGPASFFFEYGPIPAYGTRTPMMRGVLTSTPVGFTASGLAPNTRYHYRLISTDVDGLAVSRNVSFLSAPARTTIGLKVKGRDAATETLAFPTHRDQRRAAEAESGQAGAQTRCDVRQDQTSASQGQQGGSPRASHRHPRPQGATG